MQQLEAEAGFTMQRSLAAAVILYLCTLPRAGLASEERRLTAVFSALRHRRRLVHVLNRPFK